MSKRRDFGALPDAHLVTLAASGERHAFGELTRRHSAAVRALLRRMGAEAALADDLAQDAFLSAFQHIGDYRGEGPFAGWIKRIAARAYIRRWRRDSVGRRLEQGLEDDVAEPALFLETARAEDRIDLDAALLMLTPEERLCVTLCSGAGFSHAEAALALNRPLGTVKSHVRRGLDKLRRQLAPGSVASAPLPSPVEPEHV
jgi:RNA polymerase sigma-70 factor (ECF subfamily)